MNSVLPARPNLASPRLSLPLLALLLLVGSALAQAETSRSTVPLDGIENIHLLGPFNLVISQGEEEYVTIIADGEDMDKVQARIKGNTLALGRENESFWDWVGGPDRREVRFEVQVRELRYLANRGSGRVEIAPLQHDEELEINMQGSGVIEAKSLLVSELELAIRGSGTTRVGRLETDRLEISVQGSGDVGLDTLHGRRSGDDDAPEVDIVGHGSGDVRISDGEADALEIRVNGSGNVDLANVRAREADIRINGSGDVEVNVSEALDVRINGSGDVGYRGQPADIDRSINGSGDIHPRN